jgi:hypothetical protein
MAPPGRNYLGPDQQHTLQEVGDLKCLAALGKRGVDIAFVSTPAFSG